MKSKVNGFSHVLSQALLVTALLTFSINISAYGHKEDLPDCNCGVTLPKYDGGLVVAVEKFGTKPYMSGTEHLRKTTTDPMGGYHAELVAMEPEYELGARLYLKYYIADSSIDLAASLSYFEWDEHIKTFGEEGFFTFTNLTPNLPLTPTDRVTARYDNRQWNLDFEAGQTVDFYRLASVRFFCGIRLADMDTRFTNFVEQNLNFNPPPPPPNAPPLNPPVSTKSVIRYEGEFNGKGPRVGMELNWHLARHFQAHFSVSTALMVGDVDSDISVKDNLPPEIALKDVPPRRFDEERKWCVAANIESRVGLNYSHFFQNGSGIEMEVGYHISDFLSVDNKFAAALSPSGVAGTAVDDFGYHGFYVRGAYIV